MQEDTTAQQGGEQEAEAAEARDAETTTDEADDRAPQPDKLTTAQPAGEPEGAADEEPEADEEVAEATAEAEEAGGDDAVDAAEEDPALPERADEEDDVEAVRLAETEEDAIAADLDKARAEAEGYLDDLRRLQADFDNYRKRTLREQTVRAASASQALVSRLLPVLDNFELAVSAAEQSRDFDRMLKGVEMVFGEFREVLEGEGLVKIEAEGKPFDPERHEAVIAVEQEDIEPGMVVDTVRTGYELRGKVLRPAMVKVAK
ncbi:MAG: co-chaperone GrpE [Actinomycetia bacterium]|nr:co-chaperone GrpE [Actinomycetes bacterium]